MALIRHEIRCPYRVHYVCTPSGYDEILPQRNYANIKMSVNSRNEFLVGSCVKIFFNCVAIVEYRLFG